MLFTDGQLLTAADINNFLLNRETNPELEQAKALSLQRINELKQSIQHGDNLRNVPHSFVLNSKIRAWKITITRNNYKKYNNTINVSSASGFINYYNSQAFVEYDPTTMKLIGNLEFFSDYYDGKKHVFMFSSNYSASGDIITYNFGDTFRIGDSRHLITISENANLRLASPDGSRITECKVEEVPDDLTKLLAAQR